MLFKAGIIFHRSTKHLNTFLPMLESNSRYTEYEKLNISFEAKKTLVRMQKLVQDSFSPVHFLDG
jgi:hypothetical protein